jgi:hypothetical protein
LHALIDTMQKQLTDERRSEPRIQTEDPVIANVRAPSGYGQGRLLDINNRGAFIGTEMALESGELVTLEIQIPGSDRMESVRGVVARQQDGTTSGLGIEFLPANVEERDHIHYVVKTILALDLLGYERPKSNPNETVAFGRPVYRKDDDRS